MAADTVVADTVVAAVSDAAGKAVAAGVSGQPPEPYVPGSGARLPAELRLVLGEYAGIACGLFAGALACATALILLIFFADDLDRYNGLYDLLFGLALVAFSSGAFVGAWTGAEKGVDLLMAGIRFSRLLRQPSDARTAIVTASKRGGCTLILDIPQDGTDGGYRSLSEVRLALWMKADMLVPGETVNVYGGSGVESPLLISGAQRGRAFLGTVESQSAPDRPSDAASTDANSPTAPTDTPPTTATWPLLDKAEKSPPDPDTAKEAPTWEPPRWGVPAAEARLVGWAEWVASTTFSSNVLASGYDKQEVDAFRRAVRDTFLGVRNPPVRSADARPGEWFSTHWRGYTKTQVDLFLEVASIRLAAMEKDAVKVTVVYESTFGNTRKVAQAISDGVREAYPDAHVECVAVGKASAELIWFTDLLIVGGPTHRRRMTTDSSRKRNISREKKAEAKGERPHELEPDAGGPGLREWFYRLPQAKKWGHAAAFDTRLGSALAGGARFGIARKLRGHGYELVKYSEGSTRDVKYSEGFILDGAFGPLHSGEIERAKAWGAQLVRTSVAKH